MPTFRPIHPSFGAEVGGVDLLRPLDAATFAVVRETFQRHSVLVFRDQRVDDAMQIAFARRFGPLETTRRGAVGAGSELITLTNVGADGAILPPTDAQVLHGLANRLWHSDSSFKPVPALASLLSARVVPPAGGETEYVSTRVVYAALPEALRHRIEGLAVQHDFAHSRAKIDPDLNHDETRAAFPPVWQALVRRSPVTGERALFLGSHAARVAGLSQEEGTALLAELTRSATTPERIYRHAWRPGDLVLWDNRCTLHRGRPYEGAAHPRTIVRATIAGLAPSLEDASAA